MNFEAIMEEWNQAKRISFGEVRRHLEAATLAQRNTILRFICLNPKRVRPSLDDDWLYEQMSVYLLDCIVLGLGSDSDDDSVHSRFEAACSLVDWFSWFVKRDVTARLIRKYVDQITMVFENGNAAVRDCIETGFLEHALETPSNRPYFSHWKDDGILVEAYARALRWGVAHTKLGG